MELNEITLLPSLYFPHSIECFLTKQMFKDRFLLNGSIKDSYSITDMESTLNEIIQD